MNPFYSAVLGSLFRALLMLLVPMIVSTELWTPDEATAWAAGTATVLAALTLSIYQKYTTRVTVAKALEAPAGTTLEQLKDRPAPLSIG